MLLRPAEDQVKMRQKARFNHKSALPSAAPAKTADGRFTSCLEQPLIRIVFDWEL
jgi:hypothetical protein